LTLYFCLASFFKAYVPFIRLKITSSQPEHGAVPAHAFPSTAFAAIEATVQSTAHPLHFAQNGNGNCVDFDKDVAEDEEEDDEDGDEDEYVADSTKIPTRGSSRFLESIDSEFDANVVVVVVVVFGSFHS